jgi:hypothetical protein
MNTFLASLLQEKAMDEGSVAIQSRQRSCKGLLVFKRYKVIAHPLLQARLVDTGLQIVGEKGVTELPV